MAEWSEGNKRTQGHKGHKGGSLWGERDLSGDKMKPGGKRGVVAGEYDKMSVYDMCSRGFAW